MNHLLLGGKFLIGTVQALLELGHVFIRNCCEACAGQTEVFQGPWILLAEGAVLLVAYSSCVAVVQWIPLGQHIHFACCLDHS